MFDKPTTELFVNGHTNSIEGFAKDLIGSNTALTVKTLCT